MRAIRRFTVRPVLPEPLKPLGDLVNNLRWSWHPETQDLFAAIDPDIWETSGHDPVRLLGSVSAKRLRQLVDDEAFMGMLGRARADLEHYLTGERWCQSLGESAPRSMAAWRPLNS